MDECSLNIDDTNSSKESVGYLEIIFTLLTLYCFSQYCKDEYLYCYKTMPIYVYRHFMASPLLETILCDYFNECISVIWVFLLYVGEEVPVFMFSRSI